MLAKQGILSEKDRDDIIKGLEGIRQDLDEGTLIIPAGSGYEDIHSFVEGILQRGSERQESAFIQAAAATIRSPLT